MQVYLNRLLRNKNGRKKDKLEYFRRLKLPEAFKKLTKEAYERTESPEKPEQKRKPTGGLFNIIEGLEYA